jgi:hypothetical protein
MPDDTDTMQSGDASGDADAGLDYYTSADDGSSDDQGDDGDSSEDRGTSDGVDSGDYAGSAAQDSLLSDAWHDAGHLANEVYQGLKLLVGLPSESDDGTKTVFHWDGTWTTTYPDGRVRSDDGHGHEIPTTPSR